MRRENNEYNILNIFFQTNNLKINQSKSVQTYYIETEDMNFAAI